MVFQDAGQLSHGQVAHSGSNGLEGSIVGNEDSHIHEIVNRSDEVCVCESAGNGAESRSLRCSSNRLRDGEDAVNDVNDTAGEVDVLQNKDQPRANTRWWSDSQPA